MSRVAIVLAAGAGSRFGGDKLAAPIDGRSLLERAIDTALAAPAERVILVTRPGGGGPEGPGIERVDAGGPDMSDSLRSGLGAANSGSATFPSP
jgi:molybdenum cofactor cytidylyltransferase